MDIQQVAQEFTRLCKAGQFEEAGRRFWSEDVVSLEPMEGPMARCEGLQAVRAKSDWWYQNHEVHGVTTEGPYVHGSQFALRFTIDVTPRIGPMANQRFQGAEVGLYTVRDGKVVEERFFASPMPGA